jgi:hypothetical protein
MYNARRKMNDLFEDILFFIEEIEYRNPLYRLLKIIMSLFTHVLVVLALLHLFLAH